MNTTPDLQEKILLGLKNKDEKVIKELYINNFKSIQNLIMNNSGCKEDAEDIFQDAILVLYKKIRDKDFTLTCSIKTYLYSICRNQWYNRLRKKEIPKSEIKINEEVGCDPFNISEADKKELRFLIYQRHFNKLSESCRQLLILFIKNKSLMEIKSLMGFSSIDYTKTRKYLCKKVLKERIFSDPDYSKYVV